MLTMQIGIVLAVILAVAGVVQWRGQSSRREKQKYILEYAEKVTDLETRKKEEQKQQEQADEAAHTRERKIQEAMLGIKKRYGKNAILKGMNLEEGATAKDRNQTIGGHHA